MESKGRKPLADTVSTDLTPFQVIKKQANVDPHGKRIK
jgi:hypothetical protein